MVKVSVVIPIYNVESYLKESLESILNQTFNDFEVICVNDGSTDNSLNVLKSFSNDSRVKIIDKENQGAGISRNIGLSHARGEYVYFFDADDYILEDTLEKLYNNAISNRSDFVVFKSVRFDENHVNYNMPIFDLDEKFKDVDFNNFTFNHRDIKKHVMNTSFAPWTKFYKKEFLEKHNLQFPNISSYNDVLYHIQSMLLASKISFVPEYLYYYRLDNVSSLTNDETKHMNIFKVIDSVKEFLINNNFLNEYKKEFDYFKVKQINRHMKVPISEKYFKKAKIYLEDVDGRNNDLIPKNELIKYEVIIESSVDDIKNFDEKLKLKKQKNKNGRSSDENPISKESKKFSLTEFFLNKSNSYQFYKKGYDKLNKKNKKLNKKIKKIKKKNKSLSTKKEQLNNDKKQLIHENNYFKTQSEVYKYELNNLQDSLELIFNESMKFNNPKDLGLLVKLIQYKNKIDELSHDVRKSHKHDLARLDIKNFGDYSNSLIILENSDQNIFQTFPDWFSNDEGKGVVIESYSGNLDFKIKIIKDGNLKISLKSMDLKNENGERINQFIEYTSFKINNEEFIMNPRLCAHNKPYPIQKSVHDSEILDIHLEWTTYDRTNDFSYTSDKNLIYNKIRKDLLNLNFGSDFLKSIPLEFYSFYIKVLNYENYDDYDNFNIKVKNTYNFINKKELQSKIEKFSEIGVNQEKRGDSIIVSLTSFPERMDDIHFCLYSLLTQTFKPDKVVLWLANEQFPNKEEDIPEDVLKLKDNGLEINWCEDIKSYKKLIPALRKYPNDFIVTVDDDIYYPENWLEKMWNTYLDYPNTIISSRSREILKYSDYIEKYDKWMVNDDFKKPSYFNFPTGAGGTMYFPNSLSNRVFDEKYFMKLCPSGDDIWFWAMAILNNTKITSIFDPYSVLTYVNISRDVGVVDSHTLWDVNKNGKNDAQFRNILTEFPEILEILND